MSTSPKNTPQWQIRPNVHPIPVLTLLDSVTEIAYTLGEFAQIARQSMPSGVLLLVKARQVSVALRKILLDGNGSLLKRCIQNPEIHPLKSPPADSKTLRAAQTFNKQNLVLTFADGSSSNLNIPEYDHKVTVHPLYGITHETEGRSVLASPFDPEADTVKFSKWMSAKILEVNGMQFDARSVLHLMAVNEGAHTTERVPFMGPILPDEDNDARYSAIAGVKFGVFSYMHFLSVFAGLYLVQRIRETLGPIASTYEDPRAKEMCQLIELHPRGFPLQMNCAVSIATHPFFVLGKHGELVGDFSKGVSTTMRIPAR